MTERATMYLMDLDRAEREQLKGYIAPGYDELLAACAKLLAVVEKIKLDSPHISDGHTAAKAGRAALAKANRE